MNLGLVIKKNGVVTRIEVYAGDETRSRAAIAARAAAEPDKEFVVYDSDQDPEYRAIVGPGIQSQEA